VINTFCGHLEVELPATDEQQWAGADIARGLRNSTLRLLAMASLTTPQIEILRRLNRGGSLHACSDIPRFLNEVIVLSRIGVLAIDMEGTPTVTRRGARYLAGLGEDGSFPPGTPQQADVLAPDAFDLRQAVPVPRHGVETSGGPVPVA
jgi:hypothetical protein